LINAFLFVGIALMGIVLVFRARKSTAGDDARLRMWTTAGRLCPAFGCVAAGFAYLIDDLVRAVAVLAGFSLLGISLSFIGSRIAKPGDHRP